MKVLLAVILVAFTSAAWAHKVTTVFSSGAAPLAPDALKLALEGKAFTAQPAQGPRWHLGYRQDGAFTVIAGDFADEGRWTVGDSAVCTEGRKLKYLCNAMRAKDGMLFLQRKDGEVMQLVPQ